MTMPKRIFVAHGWDDQRGEWSVEEGVTIYGVGPKARRIPDTGYVRADVADGLAEALRETAEALEHARARLGMAGEGDGKDRRADAPDDFGSGPALRMTRAALAAYEAEP